jgi:hypothetical protein
VAGVSSSITSSEISVGKPVFSTKLVSDPANLPNYVPPHTVLILELKTDGIDNEKWIIDATGCQYRFRDVLVLLDKYFEEKACYDLSDRSLMTQTKQRTLTIS